MITTHIHIKGQVQGVGFRPFVFRLATALGLKGYVQNSSDGVHIVVSGEIQTIDQFTTQLRQHPPENAIIASFVKHEIKPQSFVRFAIAESEAVAKPDMIITPDLGLCADCRNELFDEKNRRYRYAFTTCVQCGPRYSVIKALPYDRDNTSMEPFLQCRHCKAEYTHPLNQRYYSQTNSCSTCGIELAIYNQDQEKISDDADFVIQQTIIALKHGKIVAVKGIGGYLLLCDAQRHDAIVTLRSRKNRPTKPLAILYPNLETLKSDVLVNEAEAEMLQSTKAPIVLCCTTKMPHNELPVHLIAPGLNRIGVMLPYAPLLAIIANDFAQPLVATSGNISGCPIIYDDETALTELSTIAELVLVHNREIVVPQDDSVMLYSAAFNTPILTRRSRGWAPGFYPFQLPFQNEKLLAIGAEIKSSFGIVNNQRCYISQFLGDQGVYEAQRTYQHTLKHLASLLHFEPDLILVDKHPGYQSSAYGRELAALKQIPLIEVQHHEAHFAAILGEHALLNCSEPIMGIIWDGTGFGDDGNIWGGECFLFEKNTFKRVAHLEYFPMLMGDKMSREPRLSALAIGKDISTAKELLREKFTASEWAVYNAALEYDNSVKCSSMGRLLDGISSMLGIIDKSNYEGEAAMLLQARAEKCELSNPGFYELPVEGNIIRWKPMLEQLSADLNSGMRTRIIATKLHRGLAQLVAKLALSFNTKHIAFSGGVMQNTLLIDYIQEALPTKQLYFHQQLSPNDECISFGQLSWFAIQQSNQTYLPKNQMQASDC